MYDPSGINGITVAEKSRTQRDESALFLR